MKLIVYYCIYKSILRHSVGYFQCLFLKEFSKFMFYRTLGLGVINVQYLLFDTTVTNLRNSVNPHIIIPIATSYFLIEDYAAQATPFG